MKEQKLQEGAILDIETTEQQILEVSNEIPEEANKVEKDEKQSFEDFKTMYKDLIDCKYREDFGMEEDEKLWEDTAKDLYLQSKNYVMTGDEYKSEESIDEKLEESVQHTKIEEDTSKDFEEDMQSIDKYLSNSDDLATFEARQIQIELYEIFLQKWKEADEKAKIEEGEQKFFNLYKSYDQLYGIGKKSPSELKTFINALNERDRISEKDYNVMMDYITKWTELINSTGYMSSYTIEESINWDYGVDAFAYFNSKENKSHQPVPEDISVCNIGDEIHLNGYTYKKVNDNDWETRSRQEHVLSNNKTDAEIQKIVDDVYANYNEEPEHITAARKRLEEECTEKVTESKVDDFIEENMFDIMQEYYKVKAEEAGLDVDEFIALDTELDVETFESIAQSMYNGQNKQLNEELSDADIKSVTKREMADNEPWEWDTEPEFAMLNIINLPYCQASYCSWLREDSYQTEVIKAVNQCDTLDEFIECAEDAHLTGAVHKKDIWCAYSFVQNVLKEYCGLSKEDRIETYKMCWDAYRLNK